MTGKPVSSIVIAGGGTAGWMAAAVLARAMPPGALSITLIESPAIGTVGVGEATIPPILTLNTMLGLDEDELIRRTGATFKLGIEFRDWGAIGERYFHPFGSYGADLEGLAFHQHWLRVGGAPLDDYSMTIAAARSGKFIRPADDPRHVHSRMAYALHFDAARYAAYLRELAMARGVTHVEGRIDGADIDERGHVAAVRLDDGRRIAGELFIDCSGFRGLLIEEALETGYEDWSRWLPMNSAVAMPTANVGPPPPYTRSTARKAGWHWRIPLQHRTGNGHVYCSDFIGDDEAAGDLIGAVEGKPLADPRVLRFKTGRRRLAWNRNVVSLGLASGFVEPLESTSIHLIQQGVVTLMSLFPHTDFNPAVTAQYNRFMQTEFEHVRDFIILHYHLTRRDDAPLWQHVRNMDVPDSLKHRMALFADRGRVFVEPADLFTETSWVAVMLGQGLVPAGHDPIADAQPIDIMRDKLDRIRAVVARGAEVMPRHESFIAENCAAPVEAVAA